MTVSSAPAFKSSPLEQYSLKNSSPQKSKNFLADVNPKTLTSFLQHRFNVLAGYSNPMRAEHGPLDRINVSRAFFFSPEASSSVKSAIESNAGYEFPKGITPGVGIWTVNNLNEVKALHEWGKHHEIQVFSDFPNEMAAGLKADVGAVPLTETEILGHRGDSGHYVENTLSSFDSALDKGFGIETDAVLTRDAKRQGTGIEYKALLIHDPYFKTNRENTEGNITPKFEIDSAVGNIPNNIKSVAQLELAQAQQAIKYDHNHEKLWTAADDVALPSLADLFNLIERRYSQYKTASPEKAKRMASSMLNLEIKVDEQNQTPKTLARAFHLTLLQLMHKCPMPICFSSSSVAVLKALLDIRQNADDKGQKAYEIAWIADAKGLALNNESANTP